MTTDLYVLAWISGFTLLLWIPYIMARVMTSGLMPALSYAADKEPLPAWAEKAKKAHYNAIENLAPFAALVLVAHLVGAASPATATASIVYFWARVAHYPAYISGIPLLRTLTYAVAWIAMIVIFYEIMT